MPKLTKKELDRLPSTLRRSPQKAQETFIRTLTSAEDTYGGDEEATHRVAFAAVKHAFEKVGDHWEAKEQKGPSDDEAALSGPAARRGARPTREGVDANASKAHLLELARRLDVRGRSRMTKPELVDAVEKANRRATQRPAPNGGRPARIEEARLDAEPSTGQHWQFLSVKL